MINAIRYARENKVPYFGICLGMQTMVIEYARNVCGLERRRFHRVRSRHAAPRHLQAARVEGHRRIWAAPCGWARGRACWQKAALRTRPTERRDQRAAPPPLRVQSRIRRELDRGGLQITGRDSGRTYVEICEIADHPWFLGCQFHPGIQVEAARAASAVHSLSSAPLARSAKRRHRPPRRAANRRRVLARRMNVELSRQFVSDAGAAGR